MSNLFTLLLIIMVSSSLGVTLTEISKISLKKVSKGVATGPEIVSKDIFRGPTVVFAVRRPG